MSEEEKAKTDDFEVITSYPLTSGSFETDDQTATSGLNPITNTTKIITPKQFRRDTPVKFRLRFLIFFVIIFNFFFNVLCSFPRTFVIKISIILL